MTIKRLTPLSIFLSLLLLACNKQLDLKPQDTVVEREVYAQEASTEQALAAVYMDFFQAATSSIAYVYGDFTTDNVHHSLYYDAFDLGTVLPDDDAVQSVWAAYYKAINEANTVIEKVPEYATYAENKQAQFVAEAKFIRAFAYLNLLRLYGDGALSGQMDGLGLPLQLTPFKGYDTEGLIGRSTNGAVYDQIVTDLQSALPALPVQHANDLQTRSRATQGGAQALLARTYLYRGDFDAAADAAEKVLTDVPTVYALATDVLDTFPANADGTAKNLSKEYVFAFPISHIRSSVTSANNNLGNAYFYKRSLWIDAALLNLYETDDQRLTKLIFEGDQQYVPERFDDKTTFKFNNPNGRDNVPMIRLPEVILTRAEALVKTEGATSEAVQLLNDVRSRARPSAAPYSVSDFTSDGELLAAILKQRRLELAFEGFYRFDRIRNEQSPRENGLPAAKYALPIPQFEIDVSKNLIKQNPGYMQ